MTESLDLDDHKNDLPKKEAIIPEQDPYDQLDPTAKAEAIRRFHKQRLVLLLMAAVAWLLSAVSWRIAPFAHTMGLPRLIWAPTALTFFVFWSRMPRSLRNFVIRSIVFPRLKTLFLVRDFLLPCLFFGLSLWSVGHAFHGMQGGHMG
ncbi:MAG: hypothetical protein ABF429_06375 [Zymomonas mobilis]|uniref:Uncharacterized protein n=1 Tax=Zymomonas mobilis subsp. mobilis (strain ATCC 10988 / DSM 424 / LMG 404 / NCIMB 8938 / NRRL B-806 / ZM1) TaxID=555217 RepID=A0A0H3G7Z0_ZYMMA|nr:hypothetical protein [Zymomonas mobilis]ACV76034.1 hypothetical protein Za10_1496 [Zymomonas mobilis subsp. mobilis NCIMB 11163]AEH63236.1 conserved hypothetical protein [Zymomonas mobilis subsp. mobilis ATCC 10988]TQL28580.1 hypothetical protein FBY54_1686 [Zymomonas mobilis]